MAQLIPVIGLQVKFKNERQKIIQYEKVGGNSMNEAVTIAQIAPQPVSNLATPSPSSILNSAVTDQSTKDQLLEKRAKIFPNSTMPWHQKVNEAAFKLAKNDASLLFKKGELRRLAEAEVRGSYNFKKGRSRSSESAEGRAEEPEIKRKKLSKELRANQMKSLSSEINELDFQVKTAQRQKAKVLYGAPTEMDFEKAKKLSEEISKKKSEIFKKQALIGELTAKSRKSGYYYRNLKKIKEGTATVTKKNAMTIDSFLKGDVETKDQKKNDEEGNSDDVELITDDEVTTSTKVYDQQDPACTGSMVIKDSEKSVPPEIEVEGDNPDISGFTEEKYASKEQTGKINGSFLEEGKTLINKKERCVYTEQ